MRHTTTRSPRLLAGSLAAAALLTLSACGDSNVADDPSTGDDTSTPSAPSTPTTSESPTAPASTPAAESPDTSEPTSAPAQPTAATGLYFVGAGPRGPKLFPFTVEAVQDPAAVLAALTTAPSDADLRTWWPADAFASASVEGTRLTVDLAPTLAQAPAGVERRAAQLSVQQVAWSAKSALKATEVVFTVGGQPATTVLGVPVTGPVKARGFFKNITQVSVTTPTEGQEVSGSFTATGANNGFEAWLGWQLVDQSGKAVKEGNTTAEGWGEKLYPWSVTVDLAGVAPGTYTFRAYNDDPSGGEGGATGPEEDTRTVVVK